MTVFIEMKRLQSTNSIDRRVSQNGDAVSHSLNQKCVSNSMKFMGIFGICFMVLSLLFSSSIIVKDPTSDSPWTFDEEASNREDDLSEPVVVPKDELLGGLLHTVFNRKSCVSRYDSLSYRKEHPKKPSPYLISKLRRYEALHKRCGPHTELYNRTSMDLKYGQYTSSSESECKYLVWISHSGLGNRILGLASAFLYALLTDRVLLVDLGNEMQDLFCEPFPEVSWLLPVDFPVAYRFNSFNQKSAESYGNMVKNNLLGNLSQPQAYVYLHMVHDYGDHDKLFFCDQDQTYLQKIPWLLMRPNNYFVPSLFLIPSFEQELGNLFPEKATVFHFLGRYLFHPTNSVWGLVTRYYQAYLANADEKLGIQIRVFETRSVPFPRLLQQILKCTTKENLLPEINRDEPIGTPQSGKHKRKAVLLTFLRSGYSEEIRNMYWEYSTATGEVISVYQPSHEEYQQTEKDMHNRKAWAEIYLLSLMDKLVTSSWSTFGYVAQGLGGLKPWILYKPENWTTPKPPCQRAMSMEPCFHNPPSYDCQKKLMGVDTGLLVPHVRHCEDMSWGLKLVDLDS